MEQEVLDAPITSAVTVYNSIAAGISLMLARHGHILKTPPVVKDDPAALATTKVSRQEMVKFRTTLEKARKAEKAESLAYGRLVDSEAARIQAFADPLELAYDRVIDSEETRLAHVAAYQLELERLRIAGHRVRIQTIKEVRETANMCRTADRLKQLIDGMPAHLEKPFEEFQGEAETVFNEVCTVLQQLLAAKLEAEAQAVELKRQQEELARQRTEQVARDLAASQARAAEEAAAQTRRNAEAAELARQRAVFEQEQAEARRRNQADADRVAAQQREIDEQKARDAAAAAELLVVKSVPPTAEDIADGVADAEVKPELLLLPDMMRCCEKAAPLGVVVCPDCAETSAAYQAAMFAPPALRLGRISTHLGFAVTADFLRSLGFEPAGRERAAVLYHSSDWPLIKAALVNHINTLPALQVS